MLDLLLDMLVAKREPAPCYHDAYSVGIPKGAYGRKSGQIHCKTTVSPRVKCVFLVVTTEIPQLRMDKVVDAPIMQVVHTPVVCNDMSSTSLS